MKVSAVCFMIVYDISFQSLDRKFLSPNQVKLTQLIKIIWVSLVQYVEQLIHLDESLKVNCLEDNRLYFLSDNHVDINHNPIESNYVC